MFAGLAAVLAVFFFTDVAFTWYFMLGALVTFAVGSVASAFRPDSALRSLSS